MIEELRTLKETPMPGKTDQLGSHTEPQGSLSESQAVRIVTIEERIEITALSKRRAKHRAEKQLRMMVNRRYAEVLRKKYIEQLSDEDMIVWSGISPGALDRIVDAAVDEFENKKRPSH